MHRAGIGQQIYRRLPAVAAEREIIEKALYLLVNLFKSGD